MTIQKHEILRTSRDRETFKDLIAMEELLCDPGWLPEETISHVISFLTLNDYRNLTIVSKQWAKASKSKSNWDKIEFKGSIKNAIKFAQGLEFHHGQDVVDLKFVITCDNKQKPAVSSNTPFSYFPHDPDAFFGPPSSQFNTFLVFPRLERFSLQFDSQFFKNIAQFLDANYLGADKGEEAYELQKGYKDLLINLSCPKLEFLDISIFNERGFDTFPIASFIASFPLLKHLVLRGESINESLFEELSRATNLKTVDLGFVNASPTRNQVLQTWADQNSVLVICNVGGQQLGGYQNCIWQSFRDMSLPEELSPWSSIIEKHEDFGHWLLYGMIWSGQKPSFIRYLFDHIGQKYVFILISLTFSSAINFCPSF